MPSQTTIDAVLNELGGSQYQPLELIRLLLKRGHNESDIKEAIIQMLHDEQLELTPDRYLHAIVLV